MPKTINDVVTELDYAIDHLKFGNGDVETFTDINGQPVINVNIEAPNHTTLSIQFNHLEINKLKSHFMTTYASKAIETINLFDPDETFNELWSQSFAEHNNFKPSEFINILQEDQQFFLEERDRLVKLLSQIIIKSNNME